MNPSSLLSARPRLTVSIGVTGHLVLPGDCADLLRETVAHVLARIRELVEEAVDPASRVLFASEAPRFRLLSSLAAGADCLVAERALELGYELQVPLPMARAEYESHFDTPGDLFAFRRLLSRASGIFEIEAANLENNHAYADAARVLLNHSDLLIALWDGRETGGIAGTAPTVAMAQGSHLPTVHLSTTEPGQVRLLVDGFVSTDWEEGLRSHLRAVLLPEPPESAGPMKKASHFAEICFRQKHVVGDGTLNLEKKLSRILESFPPQFRWPEAKAPSSPLEPPASAGTWQRLYGIFDNLSGHYSSKYRSCLVLRFAAPVGAIVFLVLGLYGDAWLNHLVGHPGSGAFLRAWLAVFFVMQIAMLLSTIAMEFLDKRVLWHKKFFSYRVMAELLRQTVFLWPSGFCDVRNRHRTYTGDKRQWTTWYYRALVRDKGLPDITLSHDELNRWMHWVRHDFVADQMLYHAKRYNREGNISAKLFRLGILLFALGILISAVRGYLASMGEPGDLSLTISGALALVLPSLAVFCTGFCGHAGYPSNRQVSQEAESCLGSIGKDIDVLLAGPEAANPYRAAQSLCYSDARAIAERIHTCCTEELMDWEALISSKSIKCN